MIRKIMKPVDLIEKHLQWKSKLQGQLSTKSWLFHRAGDCKMSFSHGLQHFRKNRRISLFRALCYADSSKVSYNANELFGAHKKSDTMDGFPSNESRSFLDV